MIQIPFLVGAAIGAGVTLYMKRTNKEESIVGTITDSVKTGVNAVSDVATTTVDTVKSTVETVKEKNAAKKVARKVSSDAK